MGIKGHIPNIVTLGNLSCGLLAIVFLFRAGPEGPDYGLIGMLMAGGMIFDFLDGLVARLLGVSSPVGKQLDSLADLVTFGVLPGMLMLFVIENGVHTYLLQSSISLAHIAWYFLALPYVGLLIPVFSALRLAKFNVDTRQTDRFHGFPTPGNAFFFLSIFLMFGLDRFEDTEGLFMGFLYQPFILPFVILVFSILLVLDFPLIALKFKNWDIKENLLRYILLGGSGILLLVFFYRAVPLIILLYFVLSVIDYFSDQPEVD